MNHSITVRPDEAPAVLWSMLYVIALFLAYYVLRPIRDELGVAGGVQNLPWLFTGTLLTMLVASPLFELLLQLADAPWRVWLGLSIWLGRTHQAQERQARAATMPCGSSQIPIEVERVKGIEPSS